MGARIVRYSEAFKQELVRELEGGRFANPVGCKNSTALHALFLYGSF